MFMPDYEEPSGPVIAMNCLTCRGTGKWWRNRKKPCEHCGGSGNTYIPAPEFSVNPRLKLLAEFSAAYTATELNEWHTVRFTPLLMREVELKQGE